MAVETLCHLAQHFFSSVMGPVQLWQLCSTAPSWLQRQCTHGFEKPSSLMASTQQVPKGSCLNAVGPPIHTDLFPGRLPPALNRATPSLPRGEASSLLQQLAQRVRLGKLINSCMLGSCPSMQHEG